MKSIIIAKQQGAVDNKQEIVEVLQDIMIVCLLPVSHAQLWSGSINQINTPYYGLLNTFMWGVILL